MNYPTRVFVDANGNLYVADSHNNRVQQFAYTGTTTFTPSSAGSYTAVVTNANGCSVTTTATNVTSCTPPTITINSNTNSICTGSSLTFNAAITNGGNSSTYQWKVNGVNVGSNSSSFTTSSLNSGDIVTCVITNNTTMQSTTSNSITVQVNSPININLTGGIACSNLLTANLTGGVPATLVWTANGVAQDTAFPTYQPNGTTVAGGNGIGNAANQFNYPTGIFVDAFGNLYVADEANYRIQKFAPGNPNGVTVAGGNGQGSAANQLNGIMWLSLIHI